MSKPGTLYFVQCEHSGPIKVGITTRHVAERVEQLQAMCPYRLVLIGMKPNSTFVEESAIKTCFADDTLWGEWMSPTPSLMRLIEDCPPPPYHLENWRFERDLLREVNSMREITYRRQQRRPAVYPHPDSLQMKQIHAEVSNYAAAER